MVQDALVSEGVVSSRLTLPHRCVAWLCYIHLCEFGTLPAHLFDPANSNPSRIVSLEHFLFPWKSREDVHTPPERLVTLFQGEPPSIPPAASEEVSVVVIMLMWCVCLYCPTDALSKCVHDGTSPAERTLACLPLYLNLLHLHKVLGR